jgi:hypothetical protein
LELNLHDPDDEFIGHEGGPSGLPQLNQEAQLSDLDSSIYGEA